MRNSHIQLLVCIKKMKIIALTLTLILTTSNLIRSQESDCIFDQLTQTNEFLKGTEFWNIHEWDNETKTALVHISEYETLEIKKGGCVHFSYYVTLSLFDDSTRLDNHEYWIDAIQTWTHKLPDFDNEHLDSLIKKRTNPEQNSDKQLVWFFDQDMYCSSELWIEREGTKTTIRIGYYQC